MVPTNRCLAEAKGLNYLADDFLRRGDRAKHAELRKRSEQLLNVGLSTDELEEKYLKGKQETFNRAYSAWFRNYLAGKVEARDFLVGGTDTISYTQGVAGGFTVPDDYLDETFEAMAEVSPMTDRNVVNFLMSGSPMKLQPAQAGGYDNSSITAQIVGEAGFQAAQAIPSVAGAKLRADITFRAALGASLEAEQDIPGFTSKIVRSISIALARKIGASVLAGRGGTDMTGITNALGSPSQNNATAGKVVSTDISNWYFAVDHYYRRAKQCGWLLNDAAYKLVRNATDNQGRPLLDFVNDKEQILGKPVYIAPDLTVGGSIGTGAALFGDLSHIIVRASALYIQRAVEQANIDVTRGECQYIGRMRADATLFDPSQGAKPPVVLIAIN